MTAIEAMQQRRSIRSYTPQPVDRATIEEIIDCARLAPTAMNDQPWEFVIVTEKSPLPASRRSSATPSSSPAPPSASSSSPDPPPAPWKTAALQLKTFSSRPCARPGSLLGRRSAATLCARCGQCLWRARQPRSHQHRLCRPSRRVALRREASPRQLPPLGALLNCR